MVMIYATYIHVGCIPFFVARDTRRRYRPGVLVLEVNAFAAPANAPSEMQLGSSCSFAVHYNPCLCGSQ